MGGRASGEPRPVSGLSPLQPEGNVSSTGVLEFAFETWYKVPQQVSFIKKQPRASTSRGPERSTRGSEFPPPRPSPLQPPVNYGSCRSPLLVYLASGGPIRFPPYSP